MTPKERIFADEYIKTRNATRAYMSAYPNIKKKTTAGSEASKLLKKPNISAYVDEELEKLHRNTIADAAEIMEYYTSVMRGEVCDETVLQSGSVIESKVKTGDRNAAAEKLAKMLGIGDQIAAQRLKLDQDKAKREIEEKRNEGILPSILEAVKNVE